jgi:hypothetical protein
LDNWFAMCPPPSLQACQLAAGPGIWTLLWCRRLSISTNEAQQAVTFGEVRDGRQTYIVVATVQPGSEAEQVNILNSLNRLPYNLENC